ncbi:MAG: NUDIX domain-containing protein [Lactobacillales bacterium]|nr:NUDIX domain-containing protein [Lactobacillales bacterium]
MEYFDVYDNHQRRTGKILPRGTALKNGENKLVVSACLFNSKGELLIQKRSKNKAQFPDYWDKSVAGGIIAGETSAQAIEREIEEELGIKINMTNKRVGLQTSWSHGWGDIYFVDCEIEIKQLNIRTEEVEEVRWVNEEELNQLIDEGKFIPYFYAKQLFKIHSIDEEYV